MAEVLLKELDHPADMSQEDIRRFAEAWRPYAPGCSTASDGDYLAYFATNVIGGLAEQDGTCYEIYKIDELGGESVGFVSLVRDAHRLKVDVLVVEERRQKQGLGRAALFAIAEIAEQYLIGVIELQPLESAIGFYEKLGFVMTPNPYGVCIMSVRPEDVLCMRDEMST